MQTPGFKLQIGNTNIMSLQQKLITTTPMVNAQLSTQPQHVTMIQSSSSPALSNPPTLTLPGPAGRLPSSIKILKPIAPKPVINYTSTVIKPAQTQEVANVASGVNAATAGGTGSGPSSVCHHVLPFGTTIKVTAGNEQLPILKSQQLIQAAASLQPTPGPPLPQLVPTQPQSPQTTQLLKQIRPASPAAVAASIVPQQGAVLSPNQNKVIINKIFYKPADGPRIVSTGNGTTPPLSPVSMPDLKRKIIISGPQQRMPSPSTATSQIQIIQSSNSVPLPRIDHLPTNVQAVLNSCTNNSSITVTPLVTPVVKEPPEPESMVEQPEPSSEVVQVASNSTFGDESEAEVSSTTTTEQLLLGGAVVESQESLNSSDLVISAESMEIEAEQREEEDDEEEEAEEEVIVVQKIVNEEERPKTPCEQEVTLENLLSEQIKSPRLQKRANSEYQQAPAPAPARRLSEPLQQEVVPEVRAEDEIPPMPKPLSVIKKSGRSSSVSRRSSSTKTIHSSLLCSEKFEMSSDESRSIKTSASSLHTISPPKKEETSSESPPAYDQDKLQTAIQNYKKSMRGGKKSRSESRSVKGGGDAKDEDKDDKEYVDGDIGSTPSDLIKWDDGIGYIKNSYLHFQFNQYGLVEPMETKEYMKHVKTNVYESVKDPLQTRITASGKNKRKLLASEMSYKCRGCKCRGTASEFATPDYCSVACMKQTKNEPLLTSIARSKKLQRKGVASSESESASASNNTPHPTSDDDSLASSLNFANAFKEKNVIPKREPVADTEPKFAWESYLAQTKGTPSPLNLFVNPYPGGTNKFRAGMKLEAIDPENNSLFCVCTIMEVRGYRMQLTFDGYSRDYDFWVNADSLDIFPPGWCRKTGRVLQPPMGYDENFHWQEYLTKTRSMAASRYLFGHLNSTSGSSNKFEVGMSLEADDLKKSGKVCVASITDKIDNRILVHFDGWDERYDYWVDIRSPYIHHINWHQENGYSITAPPDWTKGDFDWAKYIRIKARRIGRPIVPADKTLFATRDPMSFRPDMKLEVVDRKNQMLIRPATVIETDGYEIKVCFDGWPNFYSFWIEDDSPDIHPMNWCKRTAHPIEFPPNYRPASIKSTCEIPFCLGQGNAKFLSHRSHTRVGECPYRTNNWLLEDRKQLRVTHEQIVTSNGRDPTPEEAAPTAPAGAIQPDVPPPKKIKKELDESTTAALPVSRSSPAVLAATQAPPTTSAPNAAVALDPLVKTALPVITDFGPRLKQSYRLWKASSRILDRCTDGLSEYDRNPLRWSVDEVASYVERFPGCDLVGGQIRDEQINGAAFLSLTQDDLVKYLDVKLGPAIKLYNRIIHLRLEVEKHFLKF